MKMINWVPFLDAMKTTKYSYFLVNSLIKRFLSNEKFLYENNKTYINKKETNKVK